MQSGHDPARRIEAGRRGVRLNTDAIDNSAGVNTSDVEVNIKIALSTPVAEGVLNAPDRAALLGEMTEEVGHLVLRNNYLQTLALSLAQRSGTRDTAFQQRLMQMLEVRGELDRAVEYLPADSEIQERRSRGESLTRPELAVLLAYAKLSLYSELLASDVPDDAYLADELVHYFPHALQSRFPAPSPPTACGGRSSPPSLPMTSSIRAGRRPSPVSRTRPDRMRPPLPAPSSWCATASACRRSMRPSTRWTRRFPAMCSFASMPRCRISPLPAPSGCCAM